MNSEICGMYFFHLTLCRLSILFPNTIQPALELISLGKLYKIKAEPSGLYFFRVKDAKNEYNIPSSIGYCPCNEFISKCLDENQFYCRHLLAAKISDCMQIFKEAKISDEEFGPLYRGQSLIQSTKKRTTI